MGATTSGVFLVAYVLAMEMVGPQYRFYSITTLNALAWIKSVTIKIRCKNIIEILSTTSFCLRVMAGTICQYYYTFGYLTMAGLAFLLNDSWQVHMKSLDAELVISNIQKT